MTVTDVGHVRPAPRHHQERLSAIRETRRADPEQAMRRTFRADIACPPGARARCHDSDGFHKTVKMWVGVLAGLTYHKTDPLLDVMPGTRRPCQDAHRCRVGGRSGRCDLIDGM
jgi:hypothetical protein